MAQERQHLGPIARIERRIVPYPWALNCSFIERVRFFVDTSIWPGSFDREQTRIVLSNLIQGDIKDGFDRNARTKMQACDRFGLNSA